MQSVRWLSTYFFEPALIRNTHTINFRTHRFKRKRQKNLSDEKGLLEWVLQIDSVIGGMRFGGRMDERVMDLRWICLRSFNYHILYGCHFHCRMKHFSCQWEQDLSKHVCQMNFSRTLLIGLVLRILLIAFGSFVDHACT